MVCWCCEHKIYLNCITNKKNHFFINSSVMEQKSFYNFLYYLYIECLILVYIKTLKDFCAVSCGMFYRLPVHCIMMCVISQEKGALYASMVALLDCIFSQAFS